MESKAQRWAALLKNAQVLGAQSFQEKYYSLKII